MPILYPPKPMRGWVNTNLHRRLINDPSWIAEVKKKGRRCQSEVKDGTCSFWTRRGIQINLPWLSQITVALMNLAVAGYELLDGELMVKDEIFWIFDIPSMRTPLFDRRKQLEEFDFENNPHLKIMPTVNKKDGYGTCISNGDEGVVFKNLKSCYRFQMNPENQIPDWIKFKPLNAEGW
jgi:ATP-dependent DNA ligase